MALPSDFIFGTVIQLQKIYVTVLFQGHGSKVKVTAALKLYSGTPKLFVRNCCDNAHIFPFQAVSFEFLRLAASFSV